MTQNLLDQVCLFFSRPTSSDIALNQSSSFSLGAAMTVDSTFAGPSETGANSSVRGSATGGTSEYSAGSEDTLLFLEVFVSIWIGSLSVPGLSCR